MCLSACLLDGSRAGVKWGRYFPTPYCHRHVCQVTSIDPMFHQAAFLTGEGCATHRKSSDIPWHVHPSLPLPAALPAACFPTSPVSVPSLDLTWFCFILSPHPSLFKTISLIIFFLIYRSSPLNPVAIRRMETQGWYLISCYIPMPGTPCHKTVAEQISVEWMNEWDAGSCYQFQATFEKTVMIPWWPFWGGREGRSGEYWSPTRYRVICFHKCFATYKWKGNGTTQQSQLEQLPTHGQLGTDEAYIMLQICSTRELPKLCPCPIQGGLLFGLGKQLADYKSPKHMVLGIVKAHFPRDLGPCFQK